MKNYKNIRSSIALIMLMWSVLGFAQKGIGTNSPNASAALDINSTNKGLLIPRVALTGTAAAAPLASNVAGMIVYNTATVSDVTPGYYFNNGTGWLRLANSTSGDLRLVSATNHITSDAGFGSNGSSAGTGANNLFFGANAGNAITTGSNNIFLGTNSGNLASTNSNSVFIGSNAGRQNTGSDNVLVGNDAGRNIGGANRNVAIGNQAAINGVTNNSVFIGYEAGSKTDSTTVISASDGRFNSFVGYRSGKENTSGYNNTFVGYQAGKLNTSGFGNSFYGTNAGSSITTTAGSSFFGAFAGSSSTGSGNTMLGAGAGINSSTGSDNVFVGTNAGFSNGSGSNNIIIGTGAGRDATTFNSVIIGTSAGRLSSTVFGGNTYIGYRAGTAETGGEQNTFIGTDAGLVSNGGISNTFVGHNAGIAHTSGTSNVFVGATSGATATNGIENVFIGNSAGSGITSGSSNIAIGHGASLANGSNQLRIGNTIFGENITTMATSRIGIATAAHATATLHVGGDMVVASGDITTTSGDFITESNTYADYVFERALEGKSNLNKTYMFKTLNEVETFIKLNKHLPGVTGIGELKRSKDGGYMVNMSKLSIQVLEKVEELFLHTIAQQKKIEVLQSENAALQARLDRIEKALGIKGGKE